MKVLTLISLAIAASSSVTAAVDTAVKAVEPDPAPPTNVAAFAAAALSLAKSVTGTKDAPVDGQDGMPHSGPYVAEPPKQDTLSITAPSTIDNDPNSKLHPAPGSLAEEAWNMGPENDGVMLDRGKGPKDGPRGTEGGVSEKSKDRKAQEEQSGAPVEKTPAAPKEAASLPAGEETSKELNTKAKDTTDKPDKPKGAVGLEKPADLPNKPHDIPHPGPPSLSKEGGQSKLPHIGGGLGSVSIPGGDIPTFRSFVLSFTMIIFSEIGDKTFLVAALMAMRHSRMLVFSAAFSSIIIMTILSAFLGRAVPALLPQKLTTGLAAGLFFIFGAKLIREGLAMSPNEGVGAEMREVEQELNKQELDNFNKNRSTAGAQSGVSPFALESGIATAASPHHRDSTARHSSKPSSRATSPSRAAGSKQGRLGGLNNLCGLLLSPAWVQTFVMTFLGEWGDRSQIATVAMAAGDNLWWVIAGAIVGHGLCTSAAVIGGRAVAGKVSLRVVTLGGAVAFLVFGCVYLIDVLRAT